MLGVENGRYPPADLGVTVLPSHEGAAAVLAFTGHNVVAADVDPDWVHARLPVGDPAAPLNLPFLPDLCAHLGRRLNNVDMVTLAPPLPGPPPVAVRSVRDSDHPRVRRARGFRDHVRVWLVDGGVLTIGRGLGGRWEVAVEVDPASWGRGLGRSLALAARHLVPDGRPIWAQIAPGNAASVRAFLAAGYLPVGAEALLVAEPLSR